LDGGFSCAGQIRAPGAEIGGQLSMNGATLTHTGAADPALLLNQVAINGDVFFNDRFSCAGQIRMINTRILGALLDTAAAWPAGSNLSGCAYQIYIGTTGLEHGRWEPKVRTEWLARMEYASSAYRHLAAQYRAHGYPDAADAVMIAMREHRRPHLRPVRRLFDLVSRWAVGYGYRPLNLVATMAAAICLFAAVLWQAEPVQDHLVAATDADGYLYTASGETLVRSPTPDTAAPGPPARAGCAAPAAPCFSPLLFSVDTLVPLIDLDQRSTWRVDSTDRGGRALNWALSIGRLLGWLFAGAVTVVVSRYIQNPDR
jgi:hypothetical protein